MTGYDLLFLLPLVIVAGTVLLVMSSIALRRRHLLVALMSDAGFLAALIANLALLAADDGSHQVTALLIVDRSSLIFGALILFAGLIVTLLSYDYLKRRDERREEYYLLLLLAAAGALVLAGAAHFASFFLGLELLSVSLFAMIAYLRTRPDALEAGVKYLVLAGASSAFMLFGVALIYAQTGRLDFSALFMMRASPWLIAGLALLVTAVGFKLALAPFHWWTPDIYQGAPAPVTAFMATASKAAMVAALLRIAAPAGLDQQPRLWYALAAMSVISMFLGNLLALRQNSVKRLLAYSSIAHLGYVLVALLVGGTAGSVTMLAAFGVVSVMSAGETEADALETYRGLFWRRPFVAAVMTASLLSLAGIPLTAGFVAKFYLVAAGVRDAQWALVLVLIAASVIGLFYYLRVIWTMLSASDPAPAALPALSLIGGTVLAALVVALLWLGLYPAPILRLIGRVSGL
jgi:NADH-quinone oxidoreductase subunit N